MSQENMELARRQVELWNARDFRGLEEMCAPDVVLYGWAEWPESGPWIGRDAAIAQIRRMFENFGEQQVTVESITADGEWVVMRHVWHIRADQSGVAGDLPGSTALRVREGKFVESHWCREHSDALKVAGWE